MPAGGGVGHVAVQIAKVLGAYVIATASTDSMTSFAAWVDYRQVDFSKAVRDIDVVFDRGSTTGKIALTM